MEGRVEAVMGTAGQPEDSNTNIDERVSPAPLPKGPIKSRQSRVHSLCFAGADLAF